MTVLCQDPIFERRRSSVIAMRVRDRAWTYEELNKRVDAYAAALRRSGIGIGTRVGVTARRDAETVAGLFAVIRIGAIAVMLAPKSPPARLCSLREAADVECDLGPATELEDDAEGVMPVDDLDRDATILFTSGSSGTPKAVLHSLANHLYSAAGSAERLPLTPEDAWLLSLPIHHVGGLAILFRCFSAGATVVIPHSGEPLEKIVTRLSVTHLSCVPVQLRRILDSDIGLPLKALLLGGSRLPPDLVMNARQRGIPVFVTYGCTEMASQVCTGRGVETVGGPLPHRQVTIDDDGEILVRGETLFKGYLSPDGLDPARDGDGWFHTGDLGEWRNGELAVVGRRDLMFISGGENVQPEEIERALTSLPGIEDAVVVSKADPEYGRRPVAFLSGTWHPAELRRELKVRLPSFMIPDEFLSLPDMGGLKPDRAALQRRIDDDGAGL